MTFDPEFPIEEPLTLEISAALLMKLENAKVEHKLGDVLKWMYSHENEIRITQDWTRYSSTIEFNSRELFLDFCTRFPELLRGNEIEA